jgi:hypothetical protein
MYPKGLPQWTKAFGRLKSPTKNDVKEILHEVAS